MLYCSIFGVPDAKEGGGLRPNAGFGLRAMDGGASSASRYRAERIKFWNGYVRKASTAGYYRRLEEVYRYLIPPHSRVLELGSGTGDLLAAVEPSLGRRGRFCAEMLKRAAERYPQLHFIQGDADQFSLNSKFDYVILSDLINDLWDVQKAVERVASVCTPSTRIIINFYSRLWTLPLGMAARLHIANQSLNQNWLTLADLDNMFALSGFEVVRQWQEVLFPPAVPLLAPFCNRYLAKLWPLRHLALTNFIVARLSAEASTGECEPEPLVSVIVPARNEAGNIERILRRVPEMGAGTEIVFVEGHSHDDTYAAIEEAIARHPERRMRLLRQSGKGKGDAVRLGFAEAKGGVLMILDADLTVAPEDLPRFYRALRSGRGEFINGVRFRQSRLLRRLRSVRRL